MKFLSAHLGPMDVNEASIVEFPAGLPGFEDTRRFLVLQHPGQEGLVFLHSVERADLCFLALPALSVRSDYELVISDDDLELLGLAPEEAPAIGKNVAALAVISLVEGEAPTVNLLSPVVIDLRTRRAVQAIRPDDRYTPREPLLGEGAVCS